MLEKKNKKKRCSLQEKVQKILGKQVQTFMISIPLFLFKSKTCKHMVVQKLQPNIITSHNNQIRN